MEDHRLRINFTKNSRGYGYDFTLETSSLASFGVLQDELETAARDIKPRLDQLIHEWALADAAKPTAKGDSDADK